MTDAQQPGPAPAVTPSSTSPVEPRPGWQLAALLMVPLVLVILLKLLHVPELLQGLVLK